MKKSKMNKQITVIAGVVIKDNKVLMVLRNEEEQPDAHLKWEFPGGKVDFSETIEESLAREFLEETGVEVKVKELLPFVQTSYWNYEWGTQQTLCFVFLCEFIKQHAVPLDHHVKKIEWIEIEKIKDLASLPGTNEVIEIVKKELAIS